MLNIVSILDEFSYRIFKEEANFIQLTPNNYKQEILDYKVDFLFVESAWRGRDDLWEDKINNLSSELINLVQYCKDKNIPTVFWNKEDPYHFLDFLETAKLFDFIFTTDISCIPLYKKKLKHNRVYLLPFACQPRIHNPIEKFKRKSGFVFAGAYYKRFKDRNRDFALIIKALQELDNIDIYDRNYNILNTPHKFPKEYHKFIRGSLDYNKIDIAYKGYNFAINLNSIKDSSTMFSRRVFELMASNTIVISNYSVGLKKLLGDLVILVDTKESFKDKIYKLKKDKLFLKKYRQLALRKVMKEHTAKERLSFIVNKVLNKPNINNFLPKILCISFVNNLKDLNSIKEVFLNQSYNNSYLLLFYSNTIDKKNLIKNDRIVYLSKDLRKYYLKGSDDINYVALLSSNDYYGRNYLMDLALATQFSDAEIITKSGIYTLGKNNKLYNTKEIPEYSFCKYAYINSSLMYMSNIKNLNIIKFFKDISNKFSNKKILSIDSFNYCKNGIRDELSKKNKDIIDDLKNINTGDVFNEKWQEIELKNLNFLNKGCNSYLFLLKILKRKVRRVLKR